MENQFINTSNTKAFSASLIWLQITAVLPINFIAGWVMDTCFICSMLNGYLI